MEHQTSLQARIDEQHMRQKDAKAKREVAEDEEASFSIFEEMKAEVVLAKVVKEFDAKIGGDNNVRRALLQAKEAERAIRQLKLDRKDGSKQLDLYTVVSSGYLTPN